MNNMTNFEVQKINELKKNILEIKDISFEEIQIDENKTFKINFVLNNNTLSLTRGEIEDLLAVIMVKGMKC